MNNIIFIHGLESSGKGFKGRFLKEKFPHLLAPDFIPYSPKESIVLLLKKRMNQLRKYLEEKENWTIIGSSFGGLMGTLFTLKNPQKVRLLILLAPYLTNANLYEPIDAQITVPVYAVHGINDSVVSPRKAKETAEKMFINIEYLIVDDDHYLHQVVIEMNWELLITQYPLNKTKILDSKYLRQ